MQSTAAADWSGILSTSDDVNGYGERGFVQMALMGDGRVRAEVASDHGRLVVDGGAGLNDGRWHHLVLTYEPRTDGESYGVTELALYVDGVLAGSGWLNVDVYVTGELLQIGGTRDRVGFFEGVIDEVVVYERALGSEEVAGRYDSSQR